jgi:hypothetical protein
MSCQERCGLGKVLSTKELRQPFTLPFLIPSSSSDAWNRINCKGASHIMMLIHPHVGPKGTFTCNIGCSEHALEWWNNVSPFCFNVSFHSTMETWMLAGACITNLYTHFADPTLVTASSLLLCPRRLWGRRMCSLILQMWGLSLGTYVLRVNTRIEEVLYPSPQRKSW